MCGQKVGAPLQLMMPFRQYATCVPVLVGLFKKTNRLQISSLSGKRVPNLLRQEEKPLIGANAK